MKIDGVLEKIFNMRTINKRITNESLKQNNEKLRKIYELLREPCKNKKIIHIAGTNGKGSTATFLEGIFLQRDILLQSLLRHIFYGLMREFC